MCSPAAGLGQLGLPHRHNGNNTPCSETKEESRHDELCEGERCTHEECTDEVDSGSDEDRASPSPNVTKEGACNSTKDTSQDVNSNDSACE